MRVQIDQSGRIEFTKDHTVLAFSNGISFAVLIPASVKRECIAELRARGLSGPSFYVQLFAAGLFFLLRDHTPRLSRIIIDLEYYGKDAIIKRHLLNLLHRADCYLHPDQIQFQPIGKKSRAHVLALETFRGKRKPDLVLDKDTILKQFRQ